MLGNSPGRKTFLQFPECFLPFPAGIQYPDISQTQERAYPEGNQGWYCWFVIRADRSRLNGSVLVKKGMWIEGITLCYWCERPSLHRENFSIVLHISALRESSFGVEKAELSNALSGPHQYRVKERPHQDRKREPSVMQDPFLVVPFFCLRRFPIKMGERQ